VTNAIAPVHDALLVHSPAQPPVLELAPPAIPALQVALSWIVDDLDDLTAPALRHSPDVKLALRVLDVRLAIWAACRVLRDVPPVDRRDCQEAITLAGHWCARPVGPPPGRLVDPADVVEASRYTGAAAAAAACCRTVASDPGSSLAWAIDATAGFEPSGGARLRFLAELVTEYARLVAEAATP